jgi:hypothetical protein
MMKAKPLLGLAVLTTLGLLVLVAGCGAEEEGDRAPSPTPWHSPSAPTAGAFTVEPTRATAPTSVGTTSPMPSPTEPTNVVEPIVSLTESPTATPSQEPAVYLSLGDSIQYGCCGDPLLSSGELFRNYLSRRLDRPVEWVTLASIDTADEFINGPKPQLDRAVAALEEWQREGRPVVAITLSIGGNDLVEVGHECEVPGGTSCLDLYLEAGTRYSEQLPLILRRLNEAKDPHTPLLLLTYYNGSDCGQPGVEISSDELSVQGWNQVIIGAARTGGAFLADVYTPFKGKACEYVQGDDPTYEGHAVIAQVYEGVYESLPPEFVEPFDLSGDR